MRVQSEKYTRLRGMSHLTSKRQNTQKVERIIGSRVSKETETVRQRLIHREIETKIDRE